MDVEVEPHGRFDVMLGVVFRILLVLVFALGGAWIVTAVPLLNGRALIGAIIGLVIIGAALLRERAIVSYCGKHGAELALAGFLLYVVILGFATYSELFDLGWFNWLCS